MSKEIILVQTKLCYRSVNMELKVKLLINEFTRTAKSLSDKVHTAINWNIHKKKKMNRNRNL